MERRNEASRAIPQDLQSLIERRRPMTRLDDITLDEAQREVIRSLAVRARRPEDTTGAHGAARSTSGVTALFVGSDRAARENAAAALANELSVELYRVDLGQVVSKYIGETEKSLRTVFDAAERARAVLLFDEADALFGKRTDVKDAHDRYANIDVADLLERIESYGGIVILASNQKSNLDPAFLRRIRYIVELPNG